MSMSAVDDVRLLAMIRELTNVAPHLSQSAEHPNLPVHIGSSSAHSGSDRQAPKSTLISLRSASDHLETR